MKPQNLLWATGALLALCVALPTSATAQSQAEMDRQAEHAFAIADSHLNRVYYQLLGKLDKASQIKLRNTQRLWLRFRDSQADFEADRIARGGSMAPMIYSGVRADLTKARTKDLEQSLKDEGP